MGQTRRADRAGPGKTVMGAAPVFDDDGFQGLPKPCATGRADPARAPPMVPMTTLGLASNVYGGLAGRRLGRNACPTCPTSRRKISEGDEVVLPRSRGYRWRPAGTENDRRGPKDPFQVWQGKREILELAGRQAQPCNEG